MITVELNQVAGWATAMAAAPQVVRQQMAIATNALGAETVGLAQGNAPVKDGNLRANIRVMEAASQGNLRVRVGTDLVYSAQREFGGVIYPRNAKYLRFEVGGRTIYAKKVTQAGSYYMRDAGNAIEPRAERAYEAAIERALRAAGVA